MYIILTYLLGFGHMFIKDEIYLSGVFWSEFKMIISAKCIYQGSSGDKYETVHLINYMYMKVYSYNSSNKYQRLAYPKGDWLV